MESALEFKELGLTSNETKAYETLLRLGKATAAHICKESNIPYGRIYTVLESLEEKGLVRVIPENTKYYYPTSPEKLHEIIDSRIKKLMEIDDKVKNFKKIYDEHIQEPVLIAKGKSNFYKISKEMKAGQKYTYNIKYTFEVHHDFIRETKDALDRKVDVKSLGRFDAETKPAIKEWSKMYKNIRPIENDGIAMSIIDDEEVMIGLIKSNTTMLIRDKAFAKIMRQLFVKYYAYTDYEESK